MPSDRFAVSGPALISFSGGRTSAYMLHRILQAHGGRLPSDVHVVFANTGDELPPTLLFIAEIERRWRVLIHWLEYRVTAEDLPSYVEVSATTADRTGRPFDLYLEHIRTMTAAKGREPYLPGPGNRFCTTELKIRVMKKWMLDRGYAHWTNIVGIRFDEPKRWRKLNRHPPERWEVDLPLVDEKISVGEVKDFWRKSPFDLGLRGDWEGNCDACHLKMPWKVAQVFRDYPERAPKWLAREALAGKSFRPNGPSIAQLVDLARSGAVLLPQAEDEFEIKCTGCTD